MVAAAERLLEEALRLPEADQLKIAARLLANATPDPCELSEAEWLDELQRRSDHCTAHPEEMIPWSEVKTQLGIQRSQ